MPRSRAKSLSALGRAASLANRRISFLQPLRNLRARFFVLRMFHGVFPALSRLPVRMLVRFVYGVFRNNVEDDDGIDGEAVCARARAQLSRILGASSV